MPEISLLEALDNILSFANEGMSITKIQMEISGKFGLRISQKHISKTLHQNQNMFFLMEGKWHFKS
jgi:intein-encoded DNA endonuclease-like protein